jgi:2-polyprenyl-6-methoxyphenol hydroxylase-like FAD-dependent oxidoreductase
MTESVATIGDRADVLVVGAGPTGLMLANQLMNFGIKPVIIDRNSGPALHSRALGVQARNRCKLMGEW